MSILPAVPVQTGLTGLALGAGDHAHPVLPESMIESTPSARSAHLVYCFSRAPGKVRIARYSCCQWFRRCFLLIHQALTLFRKLVKIGLHSLMLLGG